MNRLAIFLFLCAAFAAALLLYPQKASAAEQISVWWPVDGVSVAGTQPFKALIDGKNTNDYQMFWQVDNGQHNPMDTNATDWPHKEASVDLSGWTWHGAGPYTVTFIAKDWQGTTLGQKSVTIKIDESLTTSPTLTPTVSTVVTPSPTPTTGISPTPTVGVSPTPVTSATPTAMITPVSNPQSVQTDNPLFVDPDSQAQKFAKELAASNPTHATLLQKIATQPQAKWFGGWNTDIFTDTYIYTWNAQTANKIPVLVLYNIPNRDCGGYSQGGAKTREEYTKWVTDLSNGIASKKSVIVLEPDSLALMECLNPQEKTDRYTMISDAIAKLSAKGADVYLDAGHSQWVASDEMATRLKAAGIKHAKGFTLNTSNFRTTEENLTFGTTVSKLVGGKHFIIDTSRNGAGPNGNEWCNPANRALGATPTSNTGNALADWFVWIKRPGESDGNCNGGPNAGDWWTEYAVGLAQRANY